MHRSVLQPLAALLIVSSLFATSAARAQNSGAAPQEPIAQPVTPPHLRTNATPEYPEQALRDHVSTEVTVAVIVDINADGTVRDATVEAPQGHGFDEAAIAAARKLVFDPARRGQRAIASRIKFQFPFPVQRAILSGRVAQQKSETDAPIADARITVRDDRGGEHTVSTGADGTWRLADVQPGAVHLTVAAPGYETTQVDEQLSVGEETTVVVRLAPGASAAAAAKPKASAEPELEVFVQGERPPREVVKHSLAREEIAAVPGTLGDALRSIQDLPGVARPPPFTGQLVVRGSAPEDTNIYVDGTRVPLVYHFGGLSSVIPTELLERIDFYPGNYSTQFGRGLGGIVDVGLRDPKQDGHFHGLAQIDLLHGQLLLEGPIANTGWNFLVAGRRSWFDLWLGPVLEDVGASVTTAPRYYDYQAMVQRDLNSHSSFRVMFFGADDKLEILNDSPNQSQPQFGGDLRGHTSFWRAQARYKNQINNQTELRVTGGVGGDSFDFGIGEYYFTLNLKPISLRTELSHTLVRQVKVNAGLDLEYVPFDVIFRFPRIPRPGEPGAGPGDIPVETDRKGQMFLPGAYLEWEVTPWHGGRIVPGLRADYATFGTGNNWDISPRLNVRQDLRSDFPRTTLKAAAGIFYQPPNGFQSDPVFGQTGLRSPRAIHYDFGFEQEFTRQLELSTDVFYKDLSSLIVQGSGNTAEGRAYGVEWMLRYKADKKFFGWLAYTLSRSEIREFPSYPMHPYQFDQTHILTALGSYNLGRGWKIGAKVRYVSGNLYTPLMPGAYDATTGTMQAAPAFPPFGKRLPAFNQIDLRAEKAWTFSAWKLTAYLDVLNVLNRQNAEGSVYNYNYTQSKNVTGLPILPSIGVRGEF